MFYTIYLFVIYLIHCNAHIQSYPHHHIELDHHRGYCQNDPFELKNVYYEKNYKEIAEKMQTELFKQLKEFKENMFCKFINDGVTLENN